MQKFKNQKSSNPLRGFAIYLISIILSAITVIYLGYHLIASFDDETVTEFALQVTENDTVEYDAYILRNETIVYAQEAGGVDYFFPDGTKVKTGAEVAAIYAGVQGSDNTRQELMALDKKLELLTASNDVDGLSATDTATLDNRIGEYYLTIREFAEHGNYQNLPNRRDELLTLLNKRQIITGRIDSFNDSIEDLMHERDLLTSNLENVRETVSTNRSGFFYSGIDGYEGIFTGDLASNMTMEKFDEILASEPQQYDQTAIGKLATDFTWSIVLETTREELRYYTKGSTFDISFPYNNDTTLKMQLTDVISPLANRRVLLVFSCFEIPEDFAFRRMQPVRIVRSSYTGLKVPISAVRLLNDRMGVYILIGSTVDFRYIDILLESDGYYIVAPQNVEEEDYQTKLALYDIMITEGKDLYIGKMIT